MKSTIPGFRSIAAFAQSVNMDRSAVCQQLKAGFCHWPRRTHQGQTRHPYYKTWTNMVDRCNSPQHHAFKYYGGRGIRVYSPWLDSVLFLNYLDTVLGPRPVKHTLDRIDNNINYEPGNLRWATMAEQNKNKRKRKKGLKYKSRSTV